MSEKKPRLTIGMAVFEDFDGVAFTLQGIRLGNDMSEVELIVVDNSPNTPNGRETANMARNCGARYIPMPENTGTTQPRNRIFQEARGDAVLVMDSHVLLRPGTINRLMDWYDANPECNDLVSGPLLYDDLKQTSTQFDPVWRGEMWGVWGNDPRASNENGEPFEIWGQGLGLFSSRRESWLEFSPHFRGFGGEEGYIHEKYRQAGRKSLCIPWLRWWHRFGRPGGVKYPLTRWNKVRNYVLGHVELNLSLDPIYEHFVKTGLMGKGEWEYLVADPIGHMSPPMNAETKQQSAKFESLEAAYQQLALNTNSYLNQHMGKLRELAGKCEVVAEITRAHESTVALLAGQPKKLYSTIHDIGTAHLVDLARVATQTELAGPADGAVEECDMLFIKPRHDDHKIAETLARNHKRVRRWIVMHDITGHFSEKTGDGGPGYSMQVQSFLDESPEWFIVSHSAAQYGLTVLGKLSEDKPATPIIVWPTGKGPGTELSKLLHGIGINPTASCSCKAMAREMDRLGVENCRLNIDKIVEGIEKNQASWGWKEKLTASFKVAAAGYFSIRSLVEEAIRLAEVK